MDKFVISGGQKLFGEAKICCAKNSILPIMAASILCDQTIVLNEIPNFVDIKNMENILKCLGADTTFCDNRLEISTKNINSFFVPKSLTEKLRSSIFVLGPMLAKHKKAKIAYPGGCKIGLRPIDIHLSGLKQLGAEICEQDGLIVCDGSHMKSSKIKLRYPSVGATENLMMASVFLEGTTVILNPAKEPEIVDLQNFLNQMGANVCGAGTEEIVILGVKNLGGGEFKPIADRIVCGTLLIACSMCGGKISVIGCREKEMASLLNELRKSGCKIDVKNDRITIESTGSLKAVSFVETLPYPGFPTDLQAQFVAMMSISSGCSKIVENLFETRFGFTGQLQKMGANICVNGKECCVCGVENLVGTKVFAGDLRGGAALVLAGLRAKGETTVCNVFHIDRGYDAFEKTLSSLGAKIIRKRDEK